MLLVVFSLYFITDINATLSSSTLYTDYQARAKRRTLVLGDFVIRGIEAYEATDVFATGEW